jgi:cellulose synthase/poly-beta-1,6-N-acetylglucosamine synthase-like glycosyltransferase
VSFLVTSAIVAVVTAVLVATGYRWIFAAAFLLRRTECAVPDRTSIRFVVVVPAHDEELVLGDCLTSIRASLSRAPRSRLVLVADNCSDRTASIARELGAEVLERDEPDVPGKGQAIDWALRRIDLTACDAIAFIDADNLVASDFFPAVAARLDGGARIVQGFDGIANPDESALTRLMAVTSMMKNLLYNGGKSALGLSPHLMGTGMVFRSDVLATHGWPAHSIVESIEQSLRLIAAGERIEFAPEARVLAQEARSLAQATPQRQRWASGQASLGGVAWRAFWSGLRTRNIGLCDAALDLLLPVRYSKTLNLAIVGSAASVAWHGVEDPITGIAAAAAAIQGVEFVASAWLFGTSRMLFSALVIAPAFLLFKGGIDLLAAAGFRSDVWFRTRRHTRLPGGGGPRSSA